MDTASGGDLWYEIAEKSLNGKHYVDGKTAIDMLEIRGNERRLNGNTLSDVDNSHGECGHDSIVADEKSFSEWLSAPGDWWDADLRVLFIDEDAVDSDRLCVSTSLMRQILTAFNVSDHFKSCLTKHHHPVKIHHHQDSRQEFCYSAVRHSDPDPNTPRISKRVLGWSRLTVWMNRYIDRDRSTILVTRCAPADKMKILHGSAAFHKGLIRYPMIIHTILLRQVWFNYYQTVENIRMPMFQEEVKQDRRISTYSNRSQKMLRIVRQLSSLMNDCDLFKDCVEVVMEENKEVSEHPPPHAQQQEIWQQDYKDCHERLKSLLGDIGVSGQYAKMYQERAKIAIDESFAIISRMNAEAGTWVAKSSMREGKLLWVIGMLGVIYLPLSLSSSLFGMGFFTTTTTTTTTQPGDGTGGDGDSTTPKLVIAPQWPWFFYVSFPMVACTMLFICLWSRYIRWSQAKEKVDEEKAEDKNWAGDIGGQALASHQIVY